MQQLDVRERRLLGILTVVFAVFVVLLVPVGLTALLTSQKSTNDEVQAAIDAIRDGRDEIVKVEAERQAITQRYASPAPPLAGLLAQLAQQSGIEIPESQDRDTIPHGKRFDERSTRIVLRRVGMLSLVRFMERVEQSGHPVRFSRLNIRKRGTEADSYDVEMLVSAFDRKNVRPKQAEGEEPVAEQEGGG
jgi:hypothetical protein